MVYFFALMCLFLGLFLGSLATFLVMLGKQNAAYLAGKAESLPQVASLQERLQGYERSIQDLTQRLSTVASQLETSRQREQKLATQIGQYHSLLQQERKAAAEKLALVNDAQAKLSDAFKALASESLRNNNAAFLNLAKTSLERFQESAKTDLDQRQQTIDALVKPVAESLAKVDSKLQELEKVRIDAYRSVSEQMKALADTHHQLRKETSNLVQAMRTPTVRGRWGEIQLKRVVELAGMLEHCDFYQQVSIDTDEGRLRPDLLVRLPAKKSIVVDSKCPLMSFLEAIECHDEEKRREKYRAHAQCVRNHITALSKKSYYEQFEQAPEFVVLFIPGEVFFSAVLEHDPELIEAGVENNVIIATPTTLIALLRAVAYGWRQERLAEHAKEIGNLGRELHKRLAKMGSHFAGVGKGLKAAIDAYNKTVGTLESRVLVTARRFSDLEVASLDSEVPEISPIEQTPRRLQASEFLEQSNKNGEP
jgi:DNA recombination protein RmuC